MFYLMVALQKPLPGRIGHVELLKGWKGVISTNGWGALVLCASMFQNIDFPKVFLDFRETM